MRLAKLELYTAAVTIGVFLIIAQGVFKRLMPPQGNFYPIRPGVTLHAPRDYRWESYPGTLLVGLRVGCGYCRSSRGFYGQMLLMEHRHQSCAHMLAVFPDDANAVRREMSPELGAMDVRSGVDLVSLEIPGTPTLLLVDGRGLVRSVWFGKLGAEEERAVLKTVACPATANAN